MKNSILSLLAASIIPFRLYAVEPAKEPTLVEKLNAWLKDKGQLTADLSAANQRAAEAEAALASAKTEAASAATTAATALTEATGKVTAAEAALETAKSEASASALQVSAFGALFAAIGFKPAADAKPEDVQKAWNTHIANGVSAKLAELGVKADKLPPPVSADQGESSIKNLKGFDKVRAAFAAQAQKN
jgi:multidrug efflux pump subunit AcrA (membrane-fusion protein)